jgi:hypothetical protein
VTVTSTATDSPDRTGDEGTLPASSTPDAVSVAVASVVAVRSGDSVVVVGDEVVAVSDDDPDEQPASEVTTPAAVANSERRPASNMGRVSESGL